MTLQEARERVERGAALLDEKQPGWAERIDIAKLEIEDPCLCVIGQLFDSNNVRFLNDCRMLGLGLYQTVDYGFNTLTACTGEYPWLEACWIDAINDRLAPRVVWTERDTTSVAVTQ